VGKEVAEKCHKRGSVNGLRYNRQGTVLVSVGTDGSVIFYEGKTMALIKRGEGSRKYGSVFGCAWNMTGEYAYIVVLIYGRARSESVDGF
jgi:hypothetical protein